MLFAFSLIRGTLRHSGRVTV